MQDNLGVGGGGKYLLRGHWCANFCSTPVVIIILGKKRLINLMKIMYLSLGEK